MRKPEPTTFFEFRICALPDDPARVQVEWNDPLDASRVVPLVVPIDSEAHKQAIQLVIKCRTGFYWPTERSASRYWPDQDTEPKEISDWRRKFAVSELPDVDAAIAAEVYQH